MKKNVFKSVKSFVITTAVCVALALGALSFTSGSVSTDTAVATAPHFIFGVY